MRDIQTTSEIKVELVQSMGADHMVVAAARVSTSGETALRYADPENAEANAGLINYLMKQKHGTPFEHSAVTFFVHAPVFVWRQWHRHRIGHSFNEESGRYKELEPLFWIPSPDRKMIPIERFKAARPEFVRASPSEYQWIIEDLADGYREAYQRYQSRLDRGFAKELARVGLPVAIYSACWVTTNPRALMNFLALRTYEPEALHTSFPQAEIEEAARACEQLFAQGWPITYAAWIKHGRVAP